MKEKRSNSQSGTSCHFSLSLHSQRIPEWDLPEEADAPAPPKNHTNRKTERHEHSAQEVQGSYILLLPDSYFTQAVAVALPGGYHFSLLNPLTVSFIQGRKCFGLLIF